MFESARFIKEFLEKLPQKQHQETYLKTYPLNKILKLNRNIEQNDEAPKIFKQHRQNTGINIQMSKEKSKVKFKVKSFNLAKKKLVYGHRWVGVKV